MKKPILISGIVLLVLLIAIVALPFLIDANQFKPILETSLSNALGRTVKVGDIHLAILSGGVSLDDVSISDNPAFGSSPFLQAKQLTAGVDLMPLIFSRRLDVSSFTVTDPKVSLLRSPAGSWNFSDLGAGGSKSPPKSGSPGSANFSAQKIQISNGTITVGTIGAGGKSQTYENVTLEASDLSYSTQFPFSLTGKTPGGGTVKVDGKAGPVNPVDASLTSIDAKIDVQNLDLASTGFVDPSSGFAGLLDFSGALRSDGKQMSSKGTIKAQRLKLVAQGLPAQVPVNIDYDTSYDLKSETGSLSQGDVHVGKALSHLSGAFNASDTAVTVQMKLAGQEMSVPDLEGILPAVGVSLPQGASLRSGTLDVSLVITGPLAKLTIDGPINLKNATVAGFSLKSKLGALSSLASPGGESTPDTDIQTLSATIRIDPQQTSANNLNLVVPAIGTITGSGVVNANQQLDCKMVAKLSSAGAGGGASSLATALSSFTGGGSNSLTIPFTITGTTSHPTFVPDVKGAIGNVMKSNSGAGNAASSIIGGFFKKKPSQ